MGVIKGKIINKFGHPVEKAIVALQDKDFNELYRTHTDEKGNYKLDVKNREYPYLYAVKNYEVDNLEFWCQDINLKSDIEVNATIDKLEVYGLKVFKIDGAYPAVMIYFRPMSLVKILQKHNDISPNIDSIKVEINNKKSEIYVVNQVKEFVGNDETMKSFLLHVSMPKEELKECDNYLSVQIVDIDGSLGQASIYFSFNK